MASRYSNQLSYAITHQDNAPIMMVEFIGATVEVERIIYRPTRKGTPRWVAIADFPGFAGMQIELFSEHIDLINFALGHDIKEGDTLDVTFDATIERWSKRRGFTGFGAIWRDYDLIYLSEVGQPATVSKSRTVEPGAVQMLAAVEKALLYAPYTLKRNFHSVRITTAREHMAGHPLYIRIEMARDGDTTAIMNVIAEHAPDGLYVELVEMKPRSMVEWKSTTHDNPLPKAAKPEQPIGQPGRDGFSTHSSSRTIKVNKRAQSKERRNDRD